MLDHRQTLLELGDRLRSAPALGGTEGTVPPGHDSFGPLELAEELGTVRTGLILLLPSRKCPPEVLPQLHEEAASRWRGLAWQNEGTAQLWTDLAARADATAERLRSGLAS